MKKSANDAKEINTDNKIHYKPENINGALNNKYIEYKSEGGKKLSIEQYLERIRLYLGNMKDELKNQIKWEIQSPMNIYLMPSKDNDDDKQLIYLKSDNIEIMIGSERNKIIKELFQLLLTKYQSTLDKSMKGSDSLPLIVLIDYTTV